MLLIYYKNAAGKICRWFCPPKGWSFGNLKDDLAAVNGNCGGGYRAYARVIRKYAGRRKTL